MSEIIQILVVVHAFITVIALFCEFIYSIINDELVTPIHIYENSKMNWFGRWFCFILLSIFSPIMLVWKIVFFSYFCIYNSIYWLFHVGRKDDE